MANPYTQLYIQFVFAVQNRQSLIHTSWEQELQKYITGIFQNLDHKLIAINGMPDHQHILVGLDPKHSISDSMEVVKSNSSKWINKNSLASGKFNWQSGYGAFSYSRSHIDRVCRYISNQKQHHKKKTFIEEYTELLIKFGIEFDERYIFHEVKY